MTQPTLPLEARRRLVCRCADHLRREEASLQRLVDRLRQVRAACLGGLDPLAGILPPPGELGEDGVSLAHDREQLRRDLASLLGVPPAQITLTLLLRALPPSLREQLEPLAARLRALLQEAEHLTHHNAVLLSYSLSFLQRLFHTLGGGYGLERYSPQGRREEGAVGSLLGAQRG